MLKGGSPCLLYTSAADGDVFEISTDPADFSGVREDLESKGYTFVSAEVEMVPDTYTKIEDPEVVIKMQKLSLIHI